MNEMDMAVKHYREGLKLDPEHKGEFWRVRMLYLTVSPPFRSGDSFEWPSWEKDGSLRVIHYLWPRLTMNNTIVIVNLDRVQGGTQIR